MIETHAKLNDIEANSAIIEHDVVVAGRRIGSMDMATTRMVGSMQALQAAFATPGTAPRQTLDMSTPVHLPQQPQPTAEASGLNVFSRCGQTEQPAACGGRPLGSYPDNLPQPAYPGTDCR